MRIITVAWDDQLCAKAFLTWYADRYCPSGKPPVCVMSTLNSTDIQETQLREASGKNPPLLLVTYAMKPKLPDGRILPALIESSDLVVRADRSMGLRVIKDVAGYSPVLEAWGLFVKSREKA